MEIFDDEEESVAASRAVRRSNALLAHLLDRHLERVGRRAGADVVFFGVDESTRLEVLERAVGESSFRRIRNEGGTRTGETELMEDLALLRDGACGAAERLKAGESEVGSGLLKDHGFSCARRSCESDWNSIDEAQRCEGFEADGLRGGNKGAMDIDGAAGDCE